MKRIVIAFIVILLTAISAHADHDEIKTIIPVAYQGWNLLGWSLQPHVTNDTIVSSGYNAIMYAALDNRVYYFEEQNGYAIADSFIIGEGFWMKSTTTVPLIQQGKAPEIRTHILYEGWNMVSPLEEEIHPLLLVYSHPIIDSIWGWDFPNYQYKDMLATQEHLVPGYGYWMYAAHDGILFYDGFSNQTPPQAPSKVVVPRSQRQPPPPPMHVGIKTWGDVKNDIHNRTAVH